METTTEEAEVQHQVVAQPDESDAEIFEPQILNQTKDEQRECDNR